MVQAVQALQTHRVAKDDPPPECWDYRFGPPCRVLYDARGKPQDLTQASHVLTLFQPCSLDLICAI